MSMYYATKAFVLSLTEGIAEEVRPKGVRVMAICPGPTKTGFVAAAGRGTEKLFHKLWNMEPATVAKIAIRGIEKGRVVIIPGILNKIMVESTRLAPRMVVGRLYAPSKNERSGRKARFCYALYRSESACADDTLRSCVSLPSDSSRIQSL